MNELISSPLPLSIEDELWTKLQKLLGLLQLSMSPAKQLSEFFSAVATVAVSFGQLGPPAEQVGQIGSEAIDNRIEMIVSFQELVNCLNLNRIKLDYNLCNRMDFLFYHIQAVIQSTGIEVQNIFANLTNEERINIGKPDRDKIKHIGSLISRFSGIANYQDARMIYDCHILPAVRLVEENIRQSLLSQVPALPMLPGK